MNARDAARICETVDRCQSGEASKVDAELLTTIAEATPALVSHQLCKAAVSILDGDLVQALKDLNDLEFVHVKG